MTHSINNGSLKHVRRVFAQGGIGNQLFNYAFCHLLQLKTDSSIALSYPKSQKFNSNNLIGVNLFCNHDIIIKREKIIHSIINLRDRISKYDKKKKVDKMLSLKNFGNIYEYNLEIAKNYRGFMQNAKLVEDVSSSIIPELQQYTDMIFGKIKNRNHTLNQTYTALHVRRSDYISGKEVYGILKTRYYQEAVTESYNLVISTDDNYSIKELERKFPFAYILHPDEFSAWQSFAILANAKTLYAANSTFSWWAGYLVVKRGGKAVLPSPFFKSKTENGKFLKNEKFQYRKSEFE